ncbi:MAG: hypothetical protein ACKPKO_03465, partial [Candidatus Fonsibacter sp.]
HPPGGCACHGDTVSRQPYLRKPPRFNIILTQLQLQHPIATMNRKNDSTIAIQQIQPIYIADLNISSNAIIYNACVGTVLWNGICRPCVQGSWSGCGLVG